MGKRLTDEGRMGAAIHRLPNRDAFRHIATKQCISLPHLSVAAPAAPLLAHSRRSAASALPDAQLAAPNKATPPPANAAARRWLPPAAPAAGLPGCSTAKAVIDSCCWLESQVAAPPPSTAAAAARCARRSTGHASAVGLLPGADQLAALLPVLPLAALPLEKRSTSGSGTGPHSSRAPSADRLYSCTAGCSPASGGAVGASVQQRSVTAPCKVSDVGCKAEAQLWHPPRISGSYVEPSRSQC